MNAVYSLFFSLSTPKVLDDIYLSGLVIIFYTLRCMFYEIYKRIKTQQKRGFVERGNFLESSGFQLRCVCVLLQNSYFVY
jgi:hypothetical protein